MDKTVSLTTALIAKKKKKKKKKKRKIVITSILFVRMRIFIITIRASKLARDSWEKREEISPAD